MRTPPGMSASVFAQALKAFAQVVGKDWVFTSEDDLNTYRDAYSPFLGEAEERQASAALAPYTVEEVQALVRVANRFKVPLYTISTGRNLGYGGAAPGYSGSVVLDLKRMNRILEVDETRAYAIVEPGVSYFDLYRHLQEKGSKLWLDVPDPGWGSLVGNALDRGGGLTMPHLRNHFEAHCGMEVVLPDGELLRTGMGALPGAQTWAQFKPGCGPMIDGLFSQSNLGVVTKMGFWLMPEPEAVLHGTVHVPGYRDLVPLVDIMSHLENTRVFNGYPDLHSPLQGAPAVADFHKMMEEGPAQRTPEHAALLKREAPPEALEAYGRRAGIPFWSCNFTFYGPEAVIKAQWAHVQKRYRAEIAGSTFQDGGFYTMPLSAAQKEQVHTTQYGIPTLRLFSMGARTHWNPNPGHGHMWFSPVIPRTGEAIFKANEVFREFALKEGFQRLAGMTLPAANWERSFIYIFGFRITEDVASNQKARAAFKKLIKIAAAQGWGEYRTSTAFQDDVMDTYSYNRHALRRFNETLKDALDPNGVLAPGRYGIWPKHLRKKGQA